MENPFRYFNSLPQIMRLMVMIYFRYPTSLRQVKDLLLEPGVDIFYEMVRIRWNRFGPMLAEEIWKR